MGIYNYIKIEVPLPVDIPSDALEFQTKDFDCFFQFIPSIRMALGGKVPRDLLQTETGAQEVKTLRRRIKMDGIYVILAGLVLLALWAFIISYREDHPKKGK